jgi:hypothetical protein
MSPYFSILKAEPKYSSKTSSSWEILHLFNDIFSLIWISEWLCGWTYKESCPILQYYLKAYPVGFKKTERTLVVIVDILTWNRNWVSKIWNIGDNVRLQFKNYGECATVWHTGRFRKVRSNTHLTCNWDRSMHQFLTGFSFYNMIGKRWPLSRAEHMLLKSQFFLCNWPGC